MADVSIALKVEDNLSKAIIGMKNAMTPFRKDVTALQKELDMLTGSKRSMSLDLKSAQQELQKTRDAYDALGKSATEAEREAAKADFMKAGANFDNINSQYKLLGKQANQTQRDIESASSAITKADNRAVKASPGILEGLGQVGLLQMGGDVASQWANVLVSSSMGQDAGSYFGGALSGAATGAALGSIIPGVGTVVGGLAGGALGLVGAGTQVYEQKNDAFKGYVQEMVGNAATKQEETFVSGSQIAANREKTQMAFTGLLGSEEGALSFLNEVESMSNKTPFLYDELSGISQSLMSFGFGVDEVIPTLTALGDAGASKGMSTSQIMEFTQYIGRMRSLDKANQEFLNPLAERGFPVYDWLSESLGVSNKQAAEMASRGDISGKFASDLILERFSTDSQYAGMMEILSGSFDGLSSTILGLEQNISNAMGKSYNEAMSPYQNERIDSYGGALGDEWKSANAMIGSGRAALDGEQMAYQDEARSVVLGLTENMQLDWGENAAQMQNLADQYRDAKDAYARGDESAGLRVENILSQADILAQAQFENSEIYKTSMTVQGELITAVQENTAAQRGAMAKYNLAQLFTGFGLTDDGGGTNTRSYWGPNAFGLTRVPYDGYRSLLHEGERVLTASEARNYTDQSNRSSSVSVSGNQFTVREEADISRIAAALADQIHLAQMGGVR